MNLGLLLIPALSGYYLLARCYITRYWIGRRSGYALFFSAAIAGVLLLAAARLVATSLPQDPVWPIAAWWSTVAPFDHADTVLISVLLATTLAEGVNLLIRDKNYWAKRAARANGDLIECLMQEALESRGHQLVEVSTKNSKSYIGFAQHSSVTTGGEPDIAVTPIASGYRDSNTRELRITTDYTPVLLDRSREHEDLRDHFRIVIPLAEVASARRFDPHAYELFRRQDADGAAQSDPESVAQGVESAR